ncbi:SPOR domain-containing protein [Ancylomarina salipaludis]|uniref:SPOR domain-containing protein n=1 Tax=Ancylomarina salipaludis TaxID=2501299 RepID=A0A4Q1JLH0_9BACT|nr:SPOR domain-containing protein [Ancylomarina salipaludis]RXQ93021.1 SPOR domain-containing protein [Ancylomarina salipaludis]
MLEISRYIKDLLFIHDCVILPGLGGFVANYCPAQENRLTNEMLPPSKAVSFNRNLKQNDGLLINCLAEEERLTYSEAKKSVELYIEDISVRLRRNERVNFSELGELFYNKRHKLQFEPAKNINFLADLFGMESFELPDQIIQENPQVRSLIIKENFWGRVSLKRKVYAAVTIPFFLGLALIPVNLNNSQHQASASFSMMESTPDVQKTTLVKQSDRISPENELVSFEPRIIYAKPKAAIKNKSIKGKYYLIAGSFSNIENAKILKTVIEANSYPATIIKNKNLYAVALDKFNSKKEADRFRRKVLQKNPNASCWVLQK